MARRRPDWANTPSLLTGTVDPTNALDQTQGVKIGDEYINTATGNIFRAVAVGTGAAVWRFVPRVLFASAVASAPLTGTTSLTAIATLAMAADVMGSNGILRVTSHWSMTNNANNKSPGLYLVAHGAGPGGIAYAGAAIASAGGYRAQHQIANRNAKNSQVAVAGGIGAGGWFTSGSGSTTGSVDTSAVADLIFAGTLASGADSLTLEAYTVELLRPDLT